MRIAAGVLASLALVAACLAHAEDLPDPAHGRELFLNYCIGCHGPEAAGCGPSARLYRPRPANLTRSTRTPDYKFSIIRNGGESMGRSPFMPPWVGQIDDGQITDIVAYLGTLRPLDPTPC